MAHQSRIQARDQFFTRRADSAAGALVAYIYIYIAASVAARRSPGSYGGTTPKPRDAASLRDQAAIVLRVVGKYQPLYCWNSKGVVVLLYFTIVLRDDLGLARSSFICVRLQEMLTRWCEIAMRITEGSRLSWPHNENWWYKKNGLHSKFAYMKMSVFYFILFLKDWAMWIVFLPISNIWGTHIY